MTVASPVFAAADGHLVVRPNVPVTGTDDRLQLGHNSPVLIADPRDSRFLVLASRLDNPDFGCALQLSGDGGRSWVPVRPVPRLPRGTDKCYAPEVSFDKRGTLYYLFVGLQGSGNSPSGAYLVTSRDRGHSFSAPLHVLDRERYMVRMAIDPTIGPMGRLHLVWLAASSPPPLGGLGPTPNPIMSAWSDDGGRTFSTPVQVSDPGRDRVVAPALALGPDHAVHVLYYDLKDDARDYQGLEGPTWEGTWSLVLASSTDGGATFGPGAMVDEAVVPTDRVMLIYTMPPAALAVDGDRLYASWSDARNGDWDVLLRRSSDGGRTWEGPRRLNDDRVGNLRHQYLPHLSVAPGGRLDAVFYDRRDDPRNVMNDVFLTSSSDRGQTFTPNLRLNDESFSSKIGTRYPLPAATGLVEYGSRIAVFAERSATLAAWTDTRNQDVDGFGQDIFATEVDRPGASGLGGGGGSPWLVPAVVIGVALAGGAAVVIWRRRSHVGPALVSALVLAASCGRGTSFPGRAPTVDVSMREYRFDMRSTVKRGRTVLRATNRGQLVHEMVIISLPRGVRPIKEQLRSSNRQVVPTVANLHQRAPGTDGTIAVDLDPGRYAFVCFVKDPDGGQHDQKGMATEFRVK
jgi:hypothetical protein